MACGILGYVVLRQRAELAGAQNDRQELATVKAQLGAAKEALAKVDKPRPASQHGAAETGDEAGARAGANQRYN